MNKETMMEIQKMIKLLGGYEMVWVVRDDGNTEVRNSHGVVVHRGTWAGCREWAKARKIWPVISGTM